MELRTTTTVAMYLHIDMSFLVVYHRHVLLYLFYGIPLFRKCHANGVQFTGLIIMNICDEVLFSEQCFFSAVLQDGSHTGQACQNYRAYFLHTTPDGEVFCCCFAA